MFEMFRAIKRLPLPRLKISPNIKSRSTSRLTVQRPKPNDIGSFVDFFRDATIFAKPRASPPDGQWPQYDTSHDLELLHHYPTCTYLTLASDSSLEHTWQVCIPQIAYSHPFLMHGLLAMSACHLAVLEPAGAERYTNLATRHYASAIGLFRPMLENIQEANAVPVIAFSTLIADLSFAMRHASPDQSTVPTPTKYANDQLDVFRLVRGVKGILSRASTWAENSPISPLLLSTNMEDPEEPLSYDAEVAVRALEKHIHINAETEDLKVGYLDAMQQFRRCYPRGSASKHCPGVIFAWPFLVSNEFFFGYGRRKAHRLGYLGFLRDVVAYVEISLVGRG
ncbi:hypothetical protein EDB80DRAFT_830602 [Ilyonectria destructans]|nr:hypothetical protein EDB80DRAFT_830602 [Ilyonectria destructans]